MNIIDVSQIPEEVKFLALSIFCLRGATYLVGGSVRDLLLGKIPKDFDIEVYNLPLQQIENLLSDLGLNYSKVGKSFGVIKVRFETGIEVDISLPRKESKSGIGHKGFVIETDEQLSPIEACSRRDFTINAIMLNLHTGEIVDPLRGRADLEDNLLVVADPKTFVEDPLRALRAVQFAARFSLWPDDASFNTIQELVSSGELKTLPGERLQEEWKKLLLKSQRPSIGLRLAKDLGILRELWPELDALVFVPQDSVHHPEGNVWEHTVLCIDAAAELTLELPDEQRWAIMLSILLHDLGKLTCTTIKADRIVAHGHEDESVRFAEKFLNSIAFFDTQLRSKILNLIQNHMFLTSVPQTKQVSNGAIRRLATRLHPATIEELAIVINNDQFGRLQDGTSGTALLEKSRNLKVHNTKPKPIVTGQEILDMGVPQGKRIGELMRLAEQLFEDGMDKVQIISQLRKEQRYGNTI